MSDKRERSVERSTRSRSSRASSASNSDSCPADPAASSSAAQAESTTSTAIHRRSAAAADANASMSEDEDEDDEDWNEDDEDEEADDAEAGEGTDIDGRQAAQLFSAILREMSGGSRSSGVSAEGRAIIHRLMHGSRRFIQRDEDGNLILSIPDGMELDLDEEEEEEGEDEEGEDAEEGESSHMEDEDGGNGPPSLEPLPIQLDREALDEYAQYTHQTSQNRPNKNLLRNLAQFQQSPIRITQPTLANISANYIPSICTSVEQFEGRAFCGKFSSGSSTSSSSSSSSAGLPSMFATATQDGLVHLYETNSWKLFKEIEARDIGWSIVDIDFSLDSRFVIYSSWSSSVHLINTSGEFELHEALDFESGSPSRFHSHVCMFGIKFSSNESREILAGLNGGVAMLYDIERKRQIWSARAHDEDINSVAWLDNSGDLFATGSDDASIRIWDRRILSSEGASAADELGGDFKSSNMVGGFLGHSYGVTCVTGMGDGNARYVLSNSKDQSMKLWDLRRMNSASDVERLCNDRLSMARRSVDYRWERVSRRDAMASATQSLKSLDHSLVTFTGHTIARTLVRCGFSPQHSTGFKYVFSGSADGKIYVYDVLTGEVVKTIAGHDDVVRDVSWQDSVLVSSSWDCTVRRHALHEENLVDNKEKMNQAQAQRGGRAAQMRRARFGGL